MPAEFDDAPQYLITASPRRGHFCTPFLGALPVDGASVSMLTDPFGIETVCATDAAASRVDEIQIDLGVGPSWDAMTGRLPVIATDVGNPAATKWPILTEALAGEGVGALFAFPLFIGPMDIGAVDLYTRDTTALSDADIRSASKLASIVAPQVLQWALDTERHPENAPGRLNEFSRRVVHQATGMVIAQLDLPPEDALLVLRAHAFAIGVPLRELATDVVNHRVDLSAAPTEI